MADQLVPSNDMSLLVQQWMRGSKGAASSSAAKPAPELPDFVPRSER